MQEYNKIDQTLHQLSQLLAKAGRSFVSPQEDDSHTNLYFDAMSRRIYTHPFGEPRRSLSLNLREQYFEWIDLDRKAEFIAPIAGQTLPQLEQTIAQAVEKAGLDAVAYREALHFEIPAYQDNTMAFSEMDEDTLQEWQYFRRLANQVGMALLGYLEAEGQPRIWPHHFDTGTYCVVNNRMGIGYGLAMEDDLVGAPYFYVSAYPQEGAVDYSNPRALTSGHWKITDNWKGAVLPLPELPPRHAMRVILRFTRQATNWYLHTS